MLCCSIFRKFKLLYLSFTFSQSQSAEILCEHHAESGAPAIQSEVPNLQLLQRDSERHSCGQSLWCTGTIH